MSKKIEYEKKLQTQLDDFSAEIEKLKSRADKTEGDAEPWHHKQIEVLQEKHKMDAELEIATGLDMETGPDIGPELTVGNRTRRNFEALVLPQLDILYNIAMKVLDNQNDAQNLIQESFITACHSWHEDQFTSSYRVWLFKIMVDILIAKFRQFAYLPFLITDADMIDGYLMYSRLEKQWPNVRPNEISFAVISKDDITKAIRDLPDDFRLVLVLSLLADFSYQEISEIVGVDREIIRIKLRQGRKLIQRNIFYRTVSMEDAVYANRKEN